MSVQDQDVNEPVGRSVVHLETDFEPNLKGLNEPRTNFGNFQRNRPDIELIFGGPTEPRITIIFASVFVYVSA